MSSALKAIDFLNNAQHITIIDVRSEGEFERGHIPGAVNIPMFNNAERAIVGTIYKQTGKEKAIEKGLEIVGPKMISFVKEAKSHALDKQILVHCWRGGMRSESFSWLLKTAGLQPQYLSRGYKAYRNYVQASFSIPLKLILLGGKTGSGKTRMLEQLKASGEQVIDMEGLCHHKGSSFGAIGQLEQPSAEQFENNLHHILKDMDVNKRIWIENESKNLGKIYIHDSFWNQMKCAPLVYVEVEKSIRIKNLVKEYACFPKELLEQAILRIQKKLGGLNFKLAMNALETSDFETITDLCLNYYDKTYLQGLNAREKSKVIIVDSSNVTDFKLIEILIDAANKFYN
jgi:tRNA 2-selenouridine synthase